MHFHGRIPVVWFSLCNCHKLKLPEMPSTHSVPSGVRAKVVAPATKGGAAGMVREEYDAKISCLHSPFLLEGRKGLSRSPFIHTGAAGAHLHLPFTIYHLQFSLCVPRLPRLHGKRRKKRSPLSRASFLFMKLYSLFFSEIRICSSGKRSKHRPDLLHLQRQHRMHIQHGAERSSGGLR